MGTETIPPISDEIAQEIHKRAEDVKSDEYKDKLKKSIEDAKVAEEKLLGPDAFNPELLEEEPED